MKKYNIKLLDKFFEGKPDEKTLALLHGGMT